MIYQSLRAKKNGRQSKCSLVPILSFLRRFSFLPEKSLFVFHHERFSICRIYKGKPKAVDWLEIFDGFVGDHVPDMAAYQRMEVMDAFRIINKRIKDSMKQ